MPSVQQRYEVRVTSEKLTFLTDGRSAALESYGVPMCDIYILGLFLSTKTTF